MSYHPTQVRGNVLYRLVETYSVTAVALISRMTSVDWNKVKVAVFSPDSQHTPTRLRIDQVPLSIKGISGERVTYVAKGTSKTATTHVKNLSVADSDTQAVDRTK